jgi:hypothetical protein
MKGIPKNRCGPVRIESVIRKMRGGSQAHMVRADNGKLYVAKFADNPQGSQILISEWICTFVLQYFRISAPELCILELESDMANDPELYFSGRTRRKIKAGRHLGIEVPVDPFKTALFDQLPARMLGKVVNAADFAKVFVVDRWLCQQDYRQAVFYRDRSSPNMRAVFIDNGHGLGGLEWDFRDSHLDGLYFDRTVYETIPMKEICRETLDRIEEFDTDLLYDVAQAMPPEWLGPSAESRFRDVLNTVCHRRRSLRSLVDRHVECLEEESHKVA